MESPSRRASPRTPTQLAARNVLRKYKRLQRNSPISTSTRQKLLSKFASSSTVELGSIFQLVKEQYSTLNVEQGQEWIVISRYYKNNPNTLS